MGGTKAGSKRPLLRQIAITAAGALGLAGFSEALEYAALVDMNNMDTAFMAAFGAVMGQVAASLDSNYNLLVRPWRHPVHAARLNMPDADDPELAEDTLALKLAELKDNEDLYREQRYHFVRGEILLEKGRYESALQEFEKGYDTDQRKTWNLASIITAASSMTISHPPDPAHAELHKAIQWYSAGNERRSLECWEKELKMHPADVEVNILCAKALSAMGKRQESDKLWSRTAHLIHDTARQDPRISERFEEKGKTFIVRGSSILDSNHFACKLSEDLNEFLIEKQEVDNAREILLTWAKECGREDDFDVMQGVAIAPNGMYAFFSRYEKGETLIEYMESGKSRAAKLRVLGKSMEYLAVVHSLLTDPALPKKDIGRHVRKRIDDLEARLSQTPENSTTYRCVPEYVKTLHELSRLVQLPANQLQYDNHVFDRDAHGFNDIITEQEKIVLIDLRTKGLIPRSYDISKKLEIGTFFANDLQGDLERLGMIGRYLAMSERLGDYEAHLKRREFWKLNADLLGSVSFYIATLSRPAYDGYREAYVRNAIHSAERLSKEFSQTEQNRQEYRQWAEELGKLLRIKPARQTSA